MSFKMKGFPYNVDNTPVYSTDMDGNILGMAQSNGTILVNKNISPLELKKNKGNSKVMKPGKDYSYPGDTVLEIPMKKSTIYNKIFKK